MPTLPHEKRVGYDLYTRVDGDHYIFQFKVPTEPKRPDPSEHPFRFSLKLHQHTRLSRIRHPNVYYVAPTFSQVRDLAANFSAGTVEQNSIALPVSGFPQLVYERHHVTYDYRNALVHSTPQEIKSSPLATVFEGPGFRRPQEVAPQVFLRDLIADLLNEDVEKSNWMELFASNSEVELAFGLATVLANMELAMIVLER